MNKSTNLVKLGTAFMIGTVLMVVGTTSQAIAQETSVNIGKLKEVLNATRTAIEAYDLAGALTQVDLAEQLLSGEGNMTTAANMTGNMSS
jgi:hypothetical protein